jgi:hypothetical protein
MMLRVTIPGALYRLSLKVCGEDNRLLNQAIQRLLERPGLLDQVVDDIAADTAIARGNHEHI